MKPILKVARKARKVLAPPTELTVSEWADTYRKLSSESSAEPGKWQTSRAPYQREMMDALNDKSVERIILMTSAQIGKTSIIENMIGYYVSQDPSPVLLLNPTVEMSETFSKDRLTPLFRDTPILKGLITDNKGRRNSGNTILRKSFPGGHITMAGANSPASLASRPIRILLGDEIDRYPLSAKDEGDPVNLAIKRTTAFWNKKVILVSTPTIKGLSRIEMAYEDSTQETYQFACPSCDEYQQLKHTHMVYHKEDDELVKVDAHCDTCGAIHSEYEWKAKEGKWIAAAEHRNTRGFHLNEYVSPWRKWLDIELDFLEAKKSPETLKTHVNTCWGETWEEQGESVDPTGLMARLEEYDDDIPVSVRTIGVDVQKNRLEATVYDWAEGEEAYAYDHLIIAGDTATDTPWHELEFELDELNPDAVAIDHGYNSGMVEKFVRGKKYCHAVKGVSGTGRDVVQDEQRRRQNLRKRLKKGSVVEPVGVDQAKALLKSRLEMQVAGAGYIHFPVKPAFDEEFFNQITAEQLVTKYVRGRPQQEWTLRRARNECTDTYVYALAALRLSKLNPAKQLKKKLREESQPTLKKKKKVRSDGAFSPSISLI